MIKLVTDSTSYIPLEYLSQYNISVISLNVILNGKSERELDINNDTFYHVMNKAPEIPTSSQPSPEEMISIFESIITQGDSVLGIFLSSNMSGTFESAHLIKDLLLEKYPAAEIELLDSRSNCMQMGYAVIEAARTASAGSPMAEVVKAAQRVIDNSRFLFTPDTLTYLKKGGRIGQAAALLGTLLQVKPILTVQNGTTTIFTKVRTKKKAIDTMVDTVLEDLKDSALGDIIVHHINAPEEGKLLADILQNHLGKEINVQCIGPVIGLHVGPGCIGIAYYKKA